MNTTTYPQPIHGVQSNSQSTRNRPETPIVPANHRSDRLNAVQNSNKRWISAAIRVGVLAFVAAAWIGVASLVKPAVQSSWLVVVPGLEVDSHDFQTPADPSGPVVHYAGWVWEAIEFIEKVIEHVETEIANGPGGQTSDEDEEDEGKKDGDGSDGEGDPDGGDPDGGDPEEVGGGSEGGEGTEGGDGNGDGDGEGDSGSDGGDSSSLPDGDELVSTIEELVDVGILSPDEVPDLYEADELELLDFLVSTLEVLYDYAAGDGE